MPKSTLTLYACEVALDDRYRLLQRVWIGFWLVLMAVTWRLWLPPDGFPAVPLLPVSSVPPAVEWTMLAVVVAAIALAAVVPRVRWQSAGWIAFLAAGIGLVLLNQHRLQPWFYQALLLAVLWASTDSRRGLAMMRLLAVAIYFYSAVGKFDFQFLHTVGQQFLQTAGGLGGVAVGQWSEGQRLWAAAVFPAVELLVAILLCFRITRLVAVGVGVAMHVATIGLLGPWGLAHQSGVLVWNAAMIAQLVLLFTPTRTRPRAREGDDETGSARRSRRLLPAALGLMVTCLALVLPLLERAGYWDHWPSWALYSPHNSRVTLQVHASAVQRLPERLQAFLTAPGEDGWQNLDLDRWSIEALGVPDYPQSRFQFAVARQVLRCHSLGRGGRIVIQGVADRWAGQRETARVSTPMQIDAAADRFLLNTRPRPCPPET
ncbi:hypothetical protein [Roseimaritima sediminicola]|uniref:hypothetical protein n=1 Tax=Roseimaritima sediminicola TaxID=2662066 RepID=UPI0012984FF7|nr:hypothetical protein [Roseimaritima sediminicola]